MFLDRAGLHVLVLVVLLLFVIVRVIVMVVDSPESTRACWVPPHKHTLFFVVPGLINEFNQAKTHEADGWGVELEG